MHVFLVNALNEEKHACKPVNSVLFLLPKAKMLVEVFKSARVRPLQQVARSFVGKDTALSCGSSNSALQEIVARAQEKNS